MKYAVPTHNGRLATHFGQSTEFAVIETDAQGQILNRQTVQAEAHGCGATPVMLARQGVNVVLAGGMGFTPQQVFHKVGIEVVMGVEESDPEKAVKDHVAGTLAAGANVCDHGESPCGHHH